MHKELIITTTPQETKLAILENDELVEFMIERQRSEAVVGNIYKGRVTKVLPGMQSAFVNIGLERDAFLYVSDFFEDAEEYDKLVSTAEDEVVASLQEGGVPKQAPPSPAPQSLHLLLSPLRRRNPKPKLQPPYRLPLRASCWRVKFDPISLMSLQKDSGNSRRASIATADHVIGIVTEEGVIETVADEIEAVIAEARHPRFLHLRHEHSNRVNRANLVNRVSRVRREANLVRQPRSK